MLANKAMIFMTFVSINIKCSHLPSLQHHEQSSEVAIFATKPGLLIFLFSKAIGENGQHLDGRL